MNNTEFTELNKNIGIRLKAVRQIYNEGIRLTVEQFAHLLDITTDKLLNYESGRSALPINVLLELYNRGIDPIFLLTGSGDIFANNNIGIAMKKNILNKNVNYDAAVKEIITKATQKDTKDKQHTILPSVIKASAGEIIQKKK
jgi:hypothetical protein